MWAKAAAICPASKQTWAQVTVGVVRWLCLSFAPSSSALPKNLNPSAPPPLPPPPPPPRQHHPSHPLQPEPHLTLLLV